MHTGPRHGLRSPSSKHPDMSKRLLCLSTYPAEDASIRQRFLTYAPIIREAGWEIRFHSIISERLFKIKNRTGIWIRLEQISRMLGGLAARLCVLAHCGHYDRIWVHREAFPILTPMAEAWLQRCCPGRVVLDFDDALYAPPPGGRDWRSALRHPGSFAEVVSKDANQVLAGSPILVEWAIGQGAAAHFIPTCIDTDLIRPSAQRSAQRVTIGWVGSWSTTPYLELVLEALCVIAQKREVRFLFVGSSNLEAIVQSLPRAEWRLWSESTEYDDLAEFDIGIMPVPDNDWNRGKCAYKLIQYTSLGIPFVASPVGMNSTFIQMSGGGQGCESSDEWIRVLDALVSNPTLRAQLGARGRQYAVANFDWRLYAPRILSILEE